MATYVDPRITHPTKHRLISDGLASVQGDGSPPEVYADDILDASFFGKELLKAANSEVARMYLQAAPTDLVSSSFPGLMHHTDKNKLDGIEDGATVGATWGINLSGIPAALSSPQAAGTASIRALGTGATQAAAGNHDHAIVADEDSGLGAASTLQEAFIALSARIKALEDATP